MRDYGKVFSAIWESATFRELSEDGRALVMYLLTCTHGTLAGVFRLPDGYVCEDVQWGSERVAKGFDELSAKGFATRDPASKWVWVIKHFEWNVLENPNQRKAAIKIAGKVPDECCWKREFMRVCGPTLGLPPVPDSPPAPPPMEPPLNPLATVPEPVSVAGAVSEAGTVAVAGVGAAAAEPSEPPASPPPPAADAPATPRGSRLPADWRLPKAWGDPALAEYPQWTPDKVRLEGEKFRDHWCSKTGKDATKIDWQATWRNCYRDPIAHRDDPKPARGVVTDASLAAAAAASTEDARRRLFGNSQETIDA